MGFHTVPCSLLSLGESLLAEGERLREIALDHVVGDAKARGDLLELEPVITMEDKCGVGARRMPLEVPGQFLEELLGFDLSGGVGIETAAKFSKKLREAEDLVRRSAS
jgi:hypothetical protein